MLNNFRCHTCGISLPSDYSFTCLQCIRSRPSYDRVFAYGNYEGVLKEAIHLMKFEKMKRLVRPLAKLLSTVDVPPVEAIVPVPLSRQRLLLRGFNQSLLLGRHLSRHISIPMRTDLLRKIKDTQPQSTLRREERLKNPKGAFAVVSRGNKGLPKSVLIVDDVSTTGATINECARILKKCGVHTVYGLVLARAMSD